MVSCEMSRSFRKPYFGNSDGAKDWKKEANRKIRRDKEAEAEILNGNGFKKKSDVWTSPMEHKRGYWDIPRMRRK